MGYTDAMAHTSMKQVRSSFEQSLAVAEQATWVPVPITRPEKGEGGKAFALVSEFPPAGDPPEAIDELGALNIPDGTPMPGEATIQKSFTKQWDDLGLQEVKFEHTQQEIRNHLMVELDYYHE